MLEFMILILVSFSSKKGPKVKILNLLLPEFKTIEALTISKLYDLLSEALKFLKPSKRRKLKVDYVKVIECRIESSELSAINHFSL